MESTTKSSSTSPQFRARLNNEIREAHSQNMQKSLPADCFTQANEKDPSIRNKKVSLPRIYHPSL